MHSARNPFTPDVFGLPSEPLDVIDLALAAGITAGGVGHVLLTPLMYGHESGLNRAWFAGSGLALAFLGMLNIARIRGDDGPTRVMSQVANPTGALLLGVAAARGASPLSRVGALLCLALSLVALRRQPRAGA